MYVKILKNGVGIALVILGIAGILLPLVPAIILIPAGLLMLGIKMDKLKKWFQKIRF